MKDFSPLAITSAAIGFPARIGVITRTDGTVTRFAESDEPITVDGDTYAVVPGLQVSAVKHTNNGEVPSCQIMAVHAADATFDTDHIDAGLFDGAEVEIYIVDRNNLSRKGLLFTGAISDTAFDPIEHQVTFDVKGPSASARIVMTQRRSPMCRTDLFSVLCGLDPDDYDVSTSVLDVVDAFSFRVTGALAQADGYFNQGVMVTQAGVAMEIAKWTQATQTIMTYLPSYRFIVTGTTLTLYPGCDKTHDSPNGCKKYSNLLNFQGEPHFNGTAARTQQV
jgi:uncharacterized phage protein (TIGR02218 family)